MAHAPNSKSISVKGIIIPSNILPAIGCFLLINLTDKNVEADININPIIDIIPTLPI